MFLDQVEKDQKVKILAKLGDEVMEFESKVLDVVPRRHGLIAEAVKKDDKVVGFTAKNLFVELHTFQKEGPPLVFKNVKVELVRDKQGAYSYIISSLAEAVVVNRRESYRVFMGKPIVVQCGANHQAYDAVLKDMSTVGFSVTLHKSVAEFNEKQIIHTVLNDRIEETCTNYSFQLFGLIVRKDEIDNGKVVYGCKFNSKVQGLDTYISIQERIKISNKRKGGNAN